MKSRKIYIIITLVLILIEFMIERFFKQGFIRYYLGDVFAAVLIYSLTKSIIYVKPIKLGVYVLIFTFLVEFFQYIDVLSILGITKNKFTSIVLGHTFSFIDLLCYFVGVTSIFIIDYFIIEKSHHS